MKKRQPSSYSRLKNNMARYILLELDRTAQPDFHPAARAAVVDYGREWLYHTRGETVVSTMDVIAALREQLGAEPRTCPTCARKFLPRIWKGPVQTYCSVECCRLGCEVRRLERRRAARAAEMAQRTCRECGASLAQRQRRDTWFCSDLCFQRWYRREVRQKRKESK